MIEEIIALEWEMFDQVQNIGGRASCQDDWQTFHIMRSSQFMCLSEKTLTLYLKDLKQAKEAGRNLVEEKYGYMMASTDPQTYQKIAPYLPVIDKERQKLIEAVVAVEVEMMEEFYAAYPKLKENARYIHSADDSLTETSAETYLRGELSVYSPQTLVSYIQDVVKYVHEDKNLIEKTVQHEVEQYGYTSIAEAEAALKGVE